MKTTLKGVSTEVVIDPEGPVVVIGEKINPTGHKRLARALKEHDFDYIREIARKQVEVGADVLDVNVGAPGIDEEKLMPEVVEAVASVVEVPLCLDSNNPRALRAGLAVAPGRPLVNSVSAERSSLEAVLPIVRDHGAAVIGLTMNDDGIPEDTDTRLAAAERILESAARLNIDVESIVIDPLVLTVGANPKAGVVTLQTIEAVSSRFGVNINLGASNVSFGLPDRNLINMAFLALAIGAGANCVISDPMRLLGIIRSSDLLLGRDAYSRRYITYIRKRGRQT